MFGSIVSAGLGLAGALGGSKGSGGGGGMPKWMAKAQEDLYKRGKSAAGAYQVTPFTNDQLRAQQMARDGVGYLDPELQDVQGQFSGLRSGVGAGDIAAFYNPYEQDVVGALMRDYDRGLDMSRTNAAEAASRAGAFGGSRQAVYNASLDSQLGDVTQRNLAQVRMGGYNNAMQAAFQNHGLKMNANQSLMSLLQQRRANRMTDTSNLAAVGDAVYGMTDRQNNVGLERLRLEQGFMPDGSGSYGQPKTGGGVAGALSGFQDGAKFGRELGDTLGSIWGGNKFDPAAASADIGKIPSLFTGW